MLAKRIRLSAHALNVSAGSLILFSHLLPNQNAEKKQGGQHEVSLFSQPIPFDFPLFLISRKEQRKAHKRTFLFAFPWLYTTFGA